MPFEMKKSGKGFFVVNTDTDKKYSNNPIPKSNAEKQMKLLNIIENNKKNKKNKNK